MTDAERIIELERELAGTRDAAHAVAPSPFGGWS